MNKKLLALKILLPILIVLLAALIALEIVSLQWQGEEENGWVVIFIFLINAIPVICMIIIGGIIVIVSVLLFAVRKKISVVITALVTLCLLLPFAVYSALFDISAFGMYIVVPIAAVCVLITNIVALILCCMIISENKKIKRERLRQEQSEIKQ